MFIGKIGADKIGKIVQQLISETNIISSLIESSSCLTNLASNFIDENGKTIMTSAGTSNKSLQGNEVKEEILKNLSDVKYVYLGSCFKLNSFISSLEEIAKEAKLLGIKVILDHGRVTNTTSKQEIESIKKVIPFVNYYFPSRDEFLYVWDSESIEEAINKVRKVSNAIIVVKDSENGSVCYYDGKIIKVPVFKVGVINPVGAGDCFNAGFIKAQDLGLDLEQSMKVASAVAAIKISQNELPTMKSIGEIMKNNNCEVSF